MHSASGLLELELKRHLAEMQTNAAVVLPRLDKDAGIIHLDRYDNLATVEVILNDKLLFVKMKTRQTKRSLYNILRRLKQKDIIGSTTLEEFWTTVPLFRECTTYPKYTM